MATNRSTCYAAVFCLAGILVHPELAAQSSDNDSSSELLRRIRAAWESRAARIVSLDQTTHIRTELDRGPSGNPANKLFYSAAIKTAEPLYETAVYAFQDDARSIYWRRNAGFQPNGELIDVKSRAAACNGMSYGDYLEDSGLILGSLRDSIPEPSLINSHNVITTTTLWTDTAAELARSGMLLDRMTIMPETSNRNVVRLGLHPAIGRSRVEVDVDPERDFIVLALRHYFGKRLSMEVELKYRKDQTQGTILKGWTKKLYKKNAITKSVHRATVTQCALNQNLDPSRFEIDFPEGTQVRVFRGEELEMEFLVQDGKMLPSHGPESTPSTGELY
ncbi:hypothetical protein Mal64_39490 [Pseudobythopirellula maris]|uniref:Uncharacterized protein n=1 Tax=Pseudobythopirellula maris TaxID=2527991 RepID=A0A5C5ZG60_9BACT|nr:hypothetical protein [Pseudobythopirellula maris]TWT86206.1 hypothetical protein Mal64_39490 [Pseudobythopirellula maris]